MIPFNRFLRLGDEEKHVAKAIASISISGDGEYTKKCQSIINGFTGGYSLLTTSCTSALEMASMIIDVKPGDEIIMPSYTFVSTADAFVSHGARIIFVDVDKETMNLNPELIQNAISDKTKAIVPVHYAGISCDMDLLMNIAKENNLWVIEDAAQGFPCTYKGKALGSIGHMGCYSFHDTKNYTMGEGGALIVNDGKLIEKADIVWQKGTNRKQFVEGMIDKYTWVDKGSSFLPSEINAAYLYGGLSKYGQVNDNRLQSWERYYSGLKELASAGYIELPFVPEYAEHNAHMFYIKTKDISVRGELIRHLKEKDIVPAFHYVPLHSSPAGKKFGEYCGEDINTTTESERLLRLPMYYNLTKDDIDYVIMAVEEFYN